MIEVKSVTKKFGDFTAVEDVSFTVGDSSIYGLIGYNGAGKTTLLKTAAGIYKPDKGKVLLDGENSYDNADVREGLFYIPDDMYFMTNSTVESMARFYKGMLSSFDEELFDRILALFSLNKSKRTSGSAGTACSANTMYIILIILWNIIIEYCFYIIYVNSTSCHIGCNQNISLTITETLHNTISLCLTHIAMQTFCKVASSF